MYSGGVSNRLCQLVKTIVGTSPIKDSHPEQVQEYWIIDLRSVYPSKPFDPLDHVHPELIIEEEVWVHVPPPPIMDDCLIWFPCFLHPMEGILGDLQFSVSVSFTGNKGENYLKGQRVMTEA